MAKRNAMTRRKYYSRPVVKRVKKAKKNGKRRIPKSQWQKGPVWPKSEDAFPKKRNTVSLASLGRGIKAKWVKIRRVKNGIRVTIKK